MDFLGQSLLLPKCLENFTLVDFEERFNFLAKNNI